ncbi:ankyrin repeat and MYND domain-containing protein 2-like isoform X2 [Gigantopelta aegis]|uniref:ankyrin repeat and MYND domain-containing protein 2-like isoform X2 n=1 Tax=Gigantopelta aegis TaxID=1735272 RepID=UPI001B88CDC3|nr:ankyrin repeat and MYND domain-containing protein 2-like isoform X2 [Gigantopelta aegis]
MAPAKKGDLTETETKLIDRVLYGTTEEVSSLLLEPSVRVDCLDQTGMTPLQHAAFRGKKDVCQMLLARGADVNSNYHDNGYSTLMFAALSGNVDVTRLMLESGANPNHINSVNRTATQMAAFVGQHQCVYVINGYFAGSDLDYYTVPQGLEKEAKLPKEVAPALLKLINSIDLYPVRVSLLLKENPELLHESYKVCKVLDCIVEKNMKSREPNDVLALKLHYFATVIRHAVKAENIDVWIKSLMKGRDSDGFPELQDRLIRQSLKDFPYIDCQLLQHIVRQLAPIKIGDTPAISILCAAINGQQFGADSDNNCSTCGVANASKKCSVCKMVHYCNQQCQKLHWPSHKKFCKQLTVKFQILEEERIKREEEEKRLEEEKRRLKEENKLEEEKKKQEADVANEMEKLNAGGDKSSGWDVPVTHWENAPLMRSWSRIDPLRSRWHHRTVRNL